MSSNGHLSPGSAKTSISQDDLGRGAFVKNLAKVIRTYGTSDSLTIGLYGPWGCGKSSLLNFVVEDLATEPKNIATLRFNPWNFSQQDTLVSTFFASLSALIRRTDKSKQAKKAAAILDIFSAVTAPATLAPGFGVIPQTFKQLADAAKGYADAFDDLEDTKRTISDTLIRSSKRYVIVIDDIDRLTEPEIRLMFQMVKSMADFKNVVYVMAFDRDIVAKALDGITGGQGYGYLEKVINVPIDVPALTGRQVSRLLTRGLTAYSERQRGYDWTNKRLGELMPIAERGFDTVRQIDRFMNALTIVEGLTKHDVDFTDLIALTMLKALEPQLHDFIASHAELFVDDLANRFGAADNQDDVDSAAISEGLTDLNVLTIDDAKSILQIVFPKVMRVFKHYKGSKEWGKSEWRRAFRACADYKMFARYFLLRVEEGDISAQDRDALWKATNSVETFERFLGRINDVERLQRTMEYLDDLQEAEIAQEQIAVIVTSVMDVGDDFERLPGLAEIFLGPAKAAVDACARLIKMLPAEQRSAVLLAALQHPPRSILMPVEVSHTLASPKLGILSAGQSAAVLAEVIRLTKAAWLNGRLLRNRRAVYLIRQWLDAPGSDAVAVIHENLNDDDTKFLELLKHYEHVETTETFFPVRFWHKGLADVFTHAELKERLERILTEGQFGSERQRVTELLDEVNRAIQESKDTASANSEDDAQLTVPPPNADVAE